MPSLRSSFTAALPVVAAVATVLPTSTAASASAGISCTVANCARFFHNSDQQGSSTYLNADNVPDFAGYTFLTSGAGQGLAVKNKAASAPNDSPNIMTVYYNSNYGGACDTLGLRHRGPVAPHVQENASFRWNATRSDCHKF